MIRIFKGEHEIEVVRDTLTLKRDNKFMDNDFRVQSNSYPFMIVESEATRLALGSRDALSVQRTTFHDVQVITPEGNFVGELQILNYTKNFRKCNLRFHSPIYLIKDEKINSFLPERINTHTFIEPAFDYEEKRETEIPIEFSNTWSTYGALISGKGYPETLFNLPTISWPLKYGEDLEEDDDWFFYKGLINGFIYDGGVKYASYNAYILNNGVDFYNVTCNAPKVYLLAPLDEAVKTVGYRLQGGFVENKFIKRILLDSKNDNLTTIDKNKFVTDINYAAPWLPFGPSSYKKTISVYNAIKPGRKYLIEIRFKKVLNHQIVSAIGVSSEQTSQEYNFLSDLQGDDFQTFSVEVTGVPSAQLTNTLTFVFLKLGNNNAEPLVVSDFKIVEVGEGKGYSTHPIINLQRFCPEWSFVDYLNELKKLFNLKITTNDHEKILNIDFFDERFTDYRGVKLESIFVEEFETVEFDSLLLKYDNVHDDAIFVNRNAVLIGQETTKEHTKEIACKFKFLPVVPNGGMIYSDFINDKGGVGLMIYDHTVYNRTTPLENYTYNGILYDLSLANIYNNFHRKSFSNYLSGGVFPAKAVLDERTIKLIANEDFVFIDNKRYYVNSMQYKELSNGLYATDFELLLMLY